MKKLIIIFSNIFILLISFNSLLAENSNYNIQQNKLEYKSHYWYLGGGIGWLPNTVQYQESGEDSTNWGKQDWAIDTFVGYSFSNWFALEGEFNYGIRETIEHDGGEREYNFYNTFLNTVFKYTFADKHTPFIKLGIGYSNYLAKGFYDDISKEKYNDWAYHLGVGYEYAITNNHSLILSYDYYRTINNNDGDIYLEGDRMYHSELILQYKYSFR
ncbi:outer membrane beta-barrel protein [Candidatus Hepatincola sp. Av]